MRSLRWDGEDAVRYNYLGLGTFVATDYREPQVKLDYATGAGANRYAGWDRFGRIVDLLWQGYGAESSSSSEEPPGLVHLQYGYDRASNRTHRADLIAQFYEKDFDELYEYDGLHRLKKFHRGRLAEGDSVIESPTLQQGWRLDATGNWRNFTQTGAGDPGQTLDQQRISNRVNEITQIARTVGPNWATPSYDRNGNMTVIPQPKQMTETYQATWDAWNRLVKLEEPDGGDGWQTLAEYQYDGQIWRTVVKNFSAGVLEETRHTYFSSQWQALEERLGATPASAPPERQFAWGLRYIDDLALRDRDTDDNGSLDERLYAMQDGNWNVVAVGDDGGEVQFRFAYEAYGYATALAAEFVQRSLVAQWETLFAGYRADSLHSLLLSRFRLLHASVGRWTRRDPLGIIDRDQYSYIGGQPITFTDPLGLQRHHWFPRVGGEGQGFVDKLCCKVAPFKIDQFTTDLPNSRTGTPHHDVHHSCFGASGYVNRAKLIYKTAKNCCDLMQQFSQLTAEAWACISTREYSAPMKVPKFHLTHYRHGGDTSGIFALRLLQACKGKVKLDAKSELYACWAKAQEAFDSCIAGGYWSALCHAKQVFHNDTCSEQYTSRLALEGGLSLAEWALDHPGAVVVVIGAIVIVVVVAVNPEVWPVLPALAPVGGRLSSGVFQGR